MKLFLICFTFLCMNSISINAQNFSKNYYVFDNIDAGQKVLITEQNYLIQYFGSLNNGKYYFGLIKTDLVGNIENNAIYDSIYSLRNILLKGNKIVFGALNNSERKLNIFKTDINGKVEKQNSLKFETGFHWPADFDSTNSKFYHTDVISYAGDSFKDNMWTNDTIQLFSWDSNFNYKKSILVPYIQSIFIYARTTIHDDNYFVTAMSYQDTAKSAGGRTRYVVLGYDSTGQKKWIYNNPKNLVDQYQKESIETIAFSDKSTAILMPYSDSEFGGSPNQQIIKLNTKGKKVWLYEDAYSNISDYYEYISIFKTKDDGIVAVGQNYFLLKDLPDPRTGIITRIDKNGKLLWKRRVWDEKVPFNHCGFNNGTELDDGSLLITGWWRDTLPDPYYDTNVWLIKLDSMGCYNPGCVGNDSVTTTQNIIVIGREMIKLSPNPAKDYLKVTWNKSPSPAKKLMVYDMSGKAVLQSAISGKSGSTELGINNLSPGMYLLKIFGDRWESAPEKFVKE